MRLLLADAIHWEPAAWILLGIVGSLGLLAVASPKRFSAVATRGGHWVDSSKLLAKLDQRVDIDAYVLPYSRYLGAALLVSAFIIGYYVYKF